MLCIDRDPISVQYSEMKRAHTDLLPREQSTTAFSTIDILMVSAGFGPDV